MDLQHTYIDGTKIEANANRYTKKQPDWMKLLLFPDAVIEKAFGKSNTKNTAWKNTLIMAKPNLQVVHAEISVIRAHKVAKSRKRGIIFINK